MSAGGGCREYHACWPTGRSFVGNSRVAIMILAISKPSLVNPGRSKNAVEAIVRFQREFPEECAWIWHAIREAILEGARH